MWVSRKEWDALQMKIDNQLEQEQLRHMLAAELRGEFGLETDEQRLLRHLADVVRYCRPGDHMRDDRDPGTEAGL